MTSLCRRIPIAGTGQLCLRCAPRTAAIGAVRYGYLPKWPTIALRLPPPAKCGGAWERSGEKKVVAPRPRSVGRFAAESGRESGNRLAEVMLAAAVTVVMGAGNRVLYKLALVPLRNYPFFLAQLATFGYVIVYFSILYIRYRAGIVTDEMLSVPKTPFLVVGLLEALGAATGMAAGAMLSGASIPILSQAFLVWQILLSYFFLGRRYKVNQLVGCSLVAIGVILTVASGSGAGHSLKEAGSNLFGRNSKTEGRFFGYVCCQFLRICIPVCLLQALFICLLLPFLSKLWGIPFGQLPNYLKDGAACFLNVGTLSRACDGAPLLPLLFVIVNMGFNISLLHLLKISSAVVSCLASTFSVPIAIYVFTLPLPYLGVASSLPTGFVAGAIILIIGLLIYAWTPSNGSSTASIT
ncbi:protein CLT1, chloroplastic-like isoform X2 [Glycine soja]|uniref:Protein CLT3, chloroplastic isoform B n=1 Tax=Glycine soja TaxID=3848 RepID=A0A445K0K1_GLYSO|nr:protein CLT1, chloroplastic-like isoform X2 [Glycine soja]RZC04287.1 Protein CLT3, chloroplastic isoform B [Glycine soja]